MARVAGFFLVAAALAATLGVLTGGAAGAPARVDVNKTTFTDSTGEDPNAPDITSITVSNTDAGLITFQVSIPNRPTFTPDMVLVLYINSDANSATGSPDLLGADYLIILAPNSSGGRDVSMGRWNGTDFADTPQLSLVSSYASGATVSVNANELSATKKMSFGAQAISGVVFDAQGTPDLTNAHRDFAPDEGHGFYTYDVKITPLRLVVKRVSTVPAKPKAGSPFTVSLVAARSDSGATIQAGTVTCKGTIAFKPVVARVHRVSAGKAVCTYQIPKTASGKTLRVNISLQFEGLTAKGNYSAKIT
jgi:hypothetical protein